MSVRIFGGRLGLITSRTECSFVTEVDYLKIEFLDVIWVR